MKGYHPLSSRKFISVSSVEGYHMVLNHVFTIKGIVFLFKLRSFRKAFSSIRASPFCLGHHLLLRRLTKAPYEPPCLASDQDGLKMCFLALASVKQMGELHWGLDFVHFLFCFRLCHQDTRSISSWFRILRVLHLLLPWLCGNETLLHLVCAVSGHVRRM